MSDQTHFTSARHPTYTSKEIQWTKWRSVYDGGDDYVNRYLKKFSDREDIQDFNKRKEITPTPNFAKAAINDVKNSIFQRLVDVNRRDGSKTYQNAITGDKFGVDLHGASMNGYIGRELLSELLIMSRVGVFVDMPNVEGKTLRDTVGTQPYLYKYRAEDILSWSFRPDQPDEYSSLLVRDYVEICHAQANLPSGVRERYRFMFIDPDDQFVHVQFFESQPVASSTTPGQEKFEIFKVDINGNRTSDDLILKINVIPFVLLEISDSLLADVSNHQIALLNLESSDINYSLKSNYPFYTEQDDDRAFSHFNKTAGAPGADGTAAGQAPNKSKEIQVGATHGRRYNKGMDRPGFIHPSPEPLQASMEKQAALKEDIRTLINLSLSNIKPKMASAESKALDERGLEAGLSNIGLELEHAERKIAFYWHMLEGSKDKASIKYPEKWSLKTDEDRRKDAASLRELRDTIPSSRFQKSISKEIARLLLSDKVSNADIDAILTEIDDADSYTADPETIFRAVELGILDYETAATILGWPSSVVEKAAKDHAERLARIAEAQSKPEGDSKTPGGVTDLDPEPGQSGKDEKRQSRDTTQEKDTTSKVRGNEREESKL